MRIAVVTLFPELFKSFLETSLVGRALTDGQLSVHLEPLRNHGLGRHLSIDDTPYGGGSGMVMRVDCVVAAIEAASAALGGSNATRILLTPQGQRLAQPLVRGWSEREALILVCGRYEGFDERVRSYVDEEVSLGDFVLTGGEVAAMAAIEAVIRLLPNVLGNQDSSREESFSPEWDGILEYPQYTRPASFRGADVPELLKSGDHRKIAAWRREQALERTRARRPDLLDGAENRKR
jgi:tRNA (guanine37-N1)-methyltransferase